MNSLSLRLHGITRLFSEMFEVPSKLAIPTWQLLSALSSLGGRAHNGDRDDTKPSLCPGVSLSTPWQVCSDFLKANVKLLWGLFEPEIKSRSSSPRTFSWKEEKVTVFFCFVFCFLVFFFFFWFREFLTCFFLFFFILRDSRNDAQPPHNRRVLCAGPSYIY